MKINKNLLWDYKFTETELETESFKRWYVARVLTSGTFHDLKDLGLGLIRQYLPQIWLPAAIRHFWEWYLGLPHAQPTRRDPYTFPEKPA